MLAWLSAWGDVQICICPTATHCLLLQEIQIVFGFTFLAPAHPGSHGQNRGSRKMVVVVVSITYV